MENLSDVRKNAIETLEIEKESISQLIPTIDDDFVKVVDGALEATVRLLKK